MMAGFALRHRRGDGSFVVELRGVPYHVTTDDALYADVSAAAEGVTLPPEPIPTAVSPPAPPPIVVTNRQLFAALALSGLITEAEALAAGRVGEVPLAIDAIFTALPDPQQAFLARLTWATMREVPRDHPLINAMIAAELATTAQVDAVFALGASL
jgi:hypothetical protein